MATAYLHSDNDLVRFCQDHGTQSGNSFSQGQCRTTVQDTERLACTLVHRHGCFHAVFRSISILNAQIAHQCMFGTYVQLVQRNFRRFDRCQDRCFHSYGNTIHIVSQSGKVRTAFY